MDKQQIIDNYHIMLDRIQQAEKSGHREPGSVRMVVVTKTFPIEVIRTLVMAGVQYIGESYFEEAKDKIEVLGDLPGLEWHMVGHVQSRKGKGVCQLFDYIHSLDSIKLAQIINTQMAMRGSRMPVLLECNVSGEDSKFGFPAWKDEQWPLLADLVKQILPLPHINVQGLMTVAPLMENGEASRPFFNRLRQLRGYLQNQIPVNKFPELSMGMSADFEVAIQEGATWIRIGQAILGPRQ